MPGLLATKLHRPSISPRRVERPHLIRRLSEGLEAGRQMTLVSAPAGFGKTTCIGQWLDTLDLPVSWLSLDPSDDDPGRFVAYLVGALQTIDESLGREIEGVVSSGQLPPVEVISAALVNDLLALDGRFLLVLDDFQVIQDRFILQVFEKLIANLPPPLHLVLLTREDPSLPLARLRANNLLTEVRAGDLRFTGQDAARFLNEVMGLALSQADVDALEERTEGWIAGLQLAGLSVRDRADPSRFIASLSGSHRHILGYLTEEVLSRQPEDIRQFLLQTSILDRLSGDLCDAVTGRADGRALLERLLSANLFLIPLDDEQRWYRYHHLFADLLRDLQKAHHKDETAGLHQRASRWYDRAGMVGEAIQHALAAADYPMAVALVESLAVEMLMQGHAKTVEGWLQAIPQEWGSRSPRANLAFAWMYLMRGAFAQAAPFIKRLQVIFSGPRAGEEDASLSAGWLALQATLLVGQGKPAEGLALADQALAIVPEEDGYVRSLIYMALAGAYQLLDDYPHSVEAFQNIIVHGRAGANFVSEMLGISGLTQMLLFHGQLHAAFEAASQGIERVERAGSLPPISAAVYGGLGQVYFEWGQVERALPYFVRAIQLSALGGYSDAEIGYAVIRSRRSQMQGDLEAAAREVQTAADLMQVTAPVWVREEVIARQVHVALAQGRLAEAEVAIKGDGFSAEGRFHIPDLAPGQDITRPVGLLYNSALRILLHKAQAANDESSLRWGIDLADRLLAGALQRQYLPVALETLLVRAQIHAALGDGASSLSGTARALALAEPEGFVSIFVVEGPPIAEAIASLLRHNQMGAVRPDYVRSILATFPGSQRPGSADEPAALAMLLTGRELDVLRLMAAGLTYEDIAARLFISVNTVRSHVKTIYGKLDVNNRTNAIQKAHQLRLL